MRETLRSFWQKPYPSLILPMTQQMQWCQKCPVFCYNPLCYVLCALHLVCVDSIEDSFIIEGSSHASHSKDKHLRFVSQHLNIVTAEYFTSWGRVLPLVSPRRAEVPVSDITGKTISDNPTLAFHISNSPFLWKSLTYPEGDLSTEDHSILEPEESKFFGVCLGV